MKWTRGDWLALCFGVLVVTRAEARDPEQPVIINEPVISLEDLALSVFQVSHGKGDLRRGTRLLGTVSASFGKIYVCITKVSTSTPLPVVQEGQECLARGVLVPQGRADNDGISLLVPQAQPFLLTDIPDEWISSPSIESGSR